MDINIILFNGVILYYLTVYLNYNILQERLLHQEIYILCILYRNAIHYNVITT